MAHAVKRKKFDSVLHVLAQQALTRAIGSRECVGQAEKHPNLARARAGAAQR
jgi:hypothetical protein